MAKKKLLDGEYYIFYRPIYDSALVEYDPFPEETILIRKRRAEYCTALGITWNPEDISFIEPFYKWSLINTLAMPPDLVAKGGGVKRVKPTRNFGHYIRGKYRDFATKNENYNLVSDAWRDAIETIEPSVHEFFEYSLYFTDEIVKRNIFRIRQAYNVRESLISPLEMKTPYSIVADNFLFEGKHFFVDEDMNIFISRPLAELISPLLNTRDLLTPITVK
jgi:hypothetical protein